MGAAERPQRARVPPDLTRVAHLDHRKVAGRAPFARERVHRAGIARKRHRQLTTTSCEPSDDYQRLELPPSRRWGRPPPPPPPPRLSSRGRAMFTVSARPSTIMPFMASTACWASELELNSTKPKPRDWPLSRSMTTLAD